MTPRQAVEKAIKKAVPECEIDRGSPGREFYVGECGADIAVVRMNQHGTWLPYNVPRDLSKTWKVIGRPITLEDVLRAIKERYENRVGFFVNQYGIFYDMKDEQKVDGNASPVLVKFAHIGWHLGKPLSEQSDDVIDFLHTVLATDKKV